METPSKLVLSIGRASRMHSAQMAGNKSLLHDSLVSIGLELIERTPRKYYLLQAPPCRSCVGNRSPHNPLSPEGAYLMRWLARIDSTNPSDKPSRQLLEVTSTMNVYIDLKTKSTRTQCIDSSPSLGSIGTSSMVHHDGNAKGDRWRAHGSGDELSVLNASTKMAREQSHVHRSNVAYIS